MGKDAQFSRLGLRFGRLEPNGQNRGRNPSDRCPAQEKVDYEHRRNLGRLPRPRYSSRQEVDANQDQDQDQPANDFRHAFLLKAGNRLAD